MPLNTRREGNNVSSSCPLFWHSTRVFIGNWGTVRPCQRQLGPQLPSLSPEYSLIWGNSVSLQHTLLQTRSNPLCSHGIYERGPTTWADLHTGPFSHWGRESLVVFAASVTRSLKSLMVFASACWSEGGAWAFARTTSAVRPAEPAGAAFDLRNVDVEVVEQGVDVFAFAPTETISFPRFFRSHCHQKLLWSCDSHLKNIENIVAPFILTYTYTYNS
jgi:hypothetical protein